MIRPPLRRLGRQLPKPASHRPATATGHPHDIASSSLCDRNLDLLARGHQILLQQMRIVRFGYCDAGVPEDLRQLVDVAAGLEPTRAEGVSAIPIAE